MWWLITITGASLMGSLHCAGMCGPFVLLATGGHASRANLLGYHLGRGLSYGLLGGLAGFLGAGLDAGALSLAGWQRAAGLLAGIGMLIAGLLAIGQWMGWFNRFATVPVGVTKWLGPVYKRLVGLPPLLRAFSIGSVAACLPCGWLYAFVLTAAGLGSPLAGAVTMLAFWVGTVPILTGVSGGWNWLPARWRLAYPAIAAVLMCLLGIGNCVRASGYDVADLTDAIRGSESPAEAVHTLQTTNLPCCHDRCVLGD
ncbi:MAG: sulfite exporter TauE/SafE family protein [Planctomycetaceae bacterium]|nr:sulfite exporter TauE/SafE family protein [Planctomycetaceae bacterium]